MPEVGMCEADCGRLRTGRKYCDNLECARDRANKRKREQRTRERGELCRQEGHAPRLAGSAGYGVCKRCSVPVRKPRPESLVHRIPGMLNSGGWDYKQPSFGSYGEVKVTKPNPKTGELIIEIRPASSFGTPREDQSRLPHIGVNEYIKRYGSGTKVPRRDLSDADSHDALRKGYEESTHAVAEVVELESTASAPEEAVVRRKRAA